MNAQRRGHASLFALAAVSSLLLGFRVGVNRQDVVGYGLQVPAPGLDLSYTYAMNLAAARGETFGRSFVSTYGPFGYWIAAMDVPGILGPWLLSQLFLVLGLGLAAAAHVAAAGLASWPARAGWLIALLFTLHTLSDEYRWFCLGVLLVLTALHEPDAPRQRAVFVLAFALAGFAMLMKLSVGLGLGLSLGAAAVLAPPRRLVFERVGLGSLAAAVAFCAGLFLHQGSLVGAVDYVRTALAVTAGYSAAMGYAEPDGWKAALAFALFVALVTAFVMAGGRTRARLSLAGLAVPLFVSWKHSVVRQDAHILIFMQFGLVVLAVLALHADAGRALRRGKPALLFLLALLALLHPITDRVLTHVPVGSALAGPAGLPGVAGLLALVDLDAHRARLAAQSAASLEWMRLPGPAKGLIGGHGVDVYPWETAYIAPNALAWAHRPSPASFASYTPALDRLNAAFFEASTRPAFVLWHSTGGGARSIDRRHLFWDEPKTLLTLLDRYELALPGVPLVLQARAGSRFGPRQKVGPLAVTWNEWVRLPRVPGPLLAEVTWDEPASAAVRRFLLRAHETYLMVRFADGERQRYRYLRDQARSGLFVDPLPRNPGDIAALFKGECPRTRVEALRFIGNPGDPPLRVMLWTLPRSDHSRNR